jgi:hypothetical protein
LGGAAREFVRRDYSFARMVQRIEALFVSVLTAEFEAAVAENFDAYYLDDEEAA